MGEDIEALRHLVYSEDFADITDDLRPDDHIEADNRARLGRLIQVVDSQVWALTAEQAGALMPLGRTVAHRLYYGCRLIVRSQRLLQSTAENWRERPVQQQLRFLKYFHRELYVALQKIEVSWTACQQAADTGAPHPTIAELFGNL
jgi:hypothetical protein